MFKQSSSHRDYSKGLNARRTILSELNERSHAARLIELTRKDLGENGLYRINFAALDETDDPDIKHALKRLYRSYHKRITEETVGQRKRS